MPYDVEDPRNISRILAGMNSNVPIERRSLIDYLENGDLTYRTKSGETVEFGREGLDYLDSITNDQEKLTLRLPIIISTDVQSEGSAWKIEGRTETAVAARILNRRIHTDDRLPMYYPDISGLKKAIPGLIFMLFVP